MSRFMKAWRVLTGAEETRRHGVGPDSDPYLQYAFGSPASSTGLAVTPRTAEGIAAVFAAVQAISESIAMMPAHIYRRTESGRERIRDHPLARIFADGPNAHQSWPEFAEWMQASVLMRGNGYAEIESDDRGAVRALMPHHPDTVTVERLASGRLRYTIRDSATRPRRLLDGEVLHLRDRSDDGLVGRSRLSRAAESLGVALATQRHAGLFFRNAARPSGVLETPDPKTEDQAKQMKQAFLKTVTGEQAHNVALATGGATFRPITFSAEDSQLLESRRFSVMEIAQIFRIPPPLLQDLTNANYSNTVELTRAFVVLTLGAWIRKWEAGLEKALLSTHARRSLFIEMQTAELLRHDLKTRFEAYKLAREAGILTPNEIRALENRNPLEGGDGLFEPLNTNRKEPNADGGDGERILPRLPLRRRGNGALAT